MPSAEGHGKARAAWDAYATWVDKYTRPAVEAVAGKAIRSYSVGKVGDLVGFWVMWHAYGGFQGLMDQGMSHTTITRRVKLFRMAFKAHPDDFVFPGLDLDVIKWHGGAGASEPQ